MRFAAAMILCSLLSVSCFAQNERERVVREDKRSLALDDSWIYDNLDEAMGTAQAARKPLMVLIRCLP